MRFVCLAVCIAVAVAVTPYGDPDYDATTSDMLIQKLNMSSLGVTRADVIACAEDWVARGK